MARRKPSLSAVVDTKVAAYFLLGTEPYAAHCERFFAALRDGIAPATWEVELGNLLWLAARSGVLPQPEALARLKLARRLATFVGALLRAFPDIAARPDDLLEQ
jgi:predicted nucleic acid-binding protein